MACSGTTEARRIIVSNASDDLVTLVTARTEFEASTIVALLQDEGIEAFAFGTAQQVFGITLSRGLRGTAVQVREADEARAQEALARRRAEAAEIDWDEVDVGERLDDAPLHEPGSMPTPARVGLIVTIIVAVVALIGMLVMMFFPWPSVP